LKTNLPIDIYGRGCQYYRKTNDPRIKGEFTNLEPYESYDFHICIENVETNHYFSEKIINALLCHTTPVYLGCRNIDQYFPDLFVPLSSDLSTDMQLLHNIKENPEKYKKKIDIDFIKNKINLLKNIKNIFQS
jgi:hypothetical protein